MEPTTSPLAYWWLIVPAVALLYFAYVTLKRKAEGAARAALASVVLGLAGIPFCPLAPFAIYFGLKAKRTAGPQPEKSVIVIATVGIALGVIGSVFLLLVVVMASIYGYAWITGQYPVN